MDTKIHGLVIEASPQELRNTMDVLTRPDPTGAHENTEIVVTINGYPVAFGKLDSAEFVNGGLRMTFRNESEAARRFHEVQDRMQRERGAPNREFFDAPTKKQGA